VPTRPLRASRRRVSPVRRPAAAAARSGWGPVGVLEGVHEDPGRTHLSSARVQLVWVGAPESRRVRQRRRPAGSAPRAAQQVPQTPPRCSAPRGAGRLSERSSSGELNRQPAASRVMRTTGNNTFNGRAQT